MNQLLSGSRLSSADRLTSKERRDSGRIARDRASPPKSLFFRGNRGSASSGRDRAVGAGFFASPSVPPELLTRIAQYTAIALVRQRFVVLFHLFLENWYPLTSIEVIEWCTRQFFST